MHAVFTLYNAGDATATGVRVRFRLPAGFRYLRASARIDDRVLGDVRGETQLTAPAGAAAGELAPGDERRIAAAFVVTRSALAAAPLEMQAAVFAHETGIVGSNVVRLTARVPSPYDTIVMTPIPVRPAPAAASVPAAHALAASEMYFANGAPLEAGCADLRIRIANRGEETARDARVHLELGDAARIEAVAGATRVGTILLVGDVQSRAHADVAVRLRVAREGRADAALAVGARLEAVGPPPFTFAPLTIPASGGAERVAGG